MHPLEISAFKMAPKVGDTLPDVTLYEGTPGGKVQLAELFSGKKGIIFGVPGAFTPGCSKTHLPGYISDFQKFKDAGADVIVCVAVNDPFVMAAWGEAHGADGKVKMLADTHSELAKALDIVLEAAPILGNNRMKRFSAVIEDNVIKAWNVEEDGTGLVCSLSNPTLEQLKAL